MVLFDNVEIGNLNKANEFSAATIQYVNNYLPERGIHIQNSKLGIKTPNPQDELDVSGVINSKALKTNLLTVWNPNNTANQDAIINLNVAGASSGNPFIGMNIYNENNAQWSLGIDNVDNLFKIKSSSDFSGSGKLVLNQSGFMGIGVEAPTAPIHLSNSISNKKILLYDITGNTHQFTGLGVETNSGVEGSLRYQVRQSDVDHIFYSGTSSSSSTELMRIKGNGKIGINEINPTSARLTVNTGNVDEFGISLVTTLGSGKGAGIDLDNRGSGGRNYGIYSGNNGSVIIYDKTLNQINFQSGVNGTEINRTLSVIGDTNGVSNTMIEIKNGSTAQSGSLLYFNKKNQSNQDNQWYTGVSRDGNYRIVKDVVDGSTNSMNVKMMIDNTKSEFYGDINVTGKVRESGFELIPVGTILPFAGSVYTTDNNDSPPPGYLICDGSLKLKSDYMKLFQVLGNLYGPSTATHFRLPDLRCRIPMGAGSNVPNRGVYTTPNSTKNLGESGGTEKHILTKDELANHNHGNSGENTIAGGSHSHSFDDNYTIVDRNDHVGRFSWNLAGTWIGRTTERKSTLSSDTHTHNLTPVGNNVPHNNLQPYLVINYIIKY